MTVEHDGGQRPGGPLVEVLDAELPAVVPAGALAQLRRQLDEEHLGQAGVQRMLLDRIDALETQVREHGEAVERYHAEHCRATELATRLEESRRAAGLSAVCHTIGGATLGATYSAPHEVRHLLLIGGSILIVAPFVLWLIHKLLMRAPGDG